MEKVDLLLVTGVVLNYFLDILALVLSRLWSDHCPIILKSGVLDYEHTSFKLFDSRFQVDGFSIRWFWLGWSLILGIQITILLISKLNLSFLKVV